MPNEARIFNISSDSLLVLVGSAGSGKSTFANAHFRSTEILSSDFFRGMVSDDEGDQTASSDAFALLHLALEKRLVRGKLTVVDATNIRPEHRARFIELARSLGRPAVAIVFETPESVCVDRARNRLGRTVSAEVIRQQSQDLPEQTDNVLRDEGFSKIFRLKPLERAEIRRSKATSGSR